MREVRPVFEVAEGRQPVQFVAGRVGGEGFARQQGGGRGSTAQSKEIAAGQNRHQLLPLYLAASAFSLLGSIHQEFWSAPT